MKTINTLPLLATSLLAITLGSAALARGPLTLSDTDGDGVISAEEILAQGEAQRAERIALYDTDGDGELSDTERDAIKADRLAVNDTDGDGELSRAERRAARQAQRELIEAQLDVNGDGIVSDAEGAGLDEVREQMRAEGGRDRSEGGKRGGGRGGDRGGDRAG